jgi:hypothetical protein
VPAEVRRLWSPTDSLPKEALHANATVIRMSSTGELTTWLEGSSLRKCGSTVNAVLEAEALAKQDKQGVARTVEALGLFEVRRLGEDIEVLVIVVYGKVCIGMMGGK